MPPAIEIPTPTHRAFFDGGRVIWEGSVRGDLFHVSDIVDSGISEQQVAKRPVRMEVPVAEIEGAGGRIVDWDAADQI